MWSRIVPMADLRLYLPDFESVELIRCSPPSWMVRLALEEKGIDHDLQAFDFGAREHRRGDLLELNPRGTIPILQHGDLVLVEALSMLQYIDDLSDEPALMPKGAGRAIALDRLHTSGHLKSVGMELFGYLMRMTAEERDPIRVDALIGQLQGELEHWERHYAAADEATPLTLVDISVMTYVATAARLGLQLTPRFPRLAAALATWKRRPAVARTWPSGWSERPLNVLSG